MDRRAALLGMLALGGLPARLAAQPGKRPFRIGLLPELSAQHRQLFLDAMAEQRWMNERDFVLVEPEGAVRTRMVPSASRRASEDLSSVTGQLMDQKPDVVVATSTAYALAARRVSTEVPVVMWTSGYPVEAGIVEKLARPGKNVTGNSIYAGTGLWGKMVELLHEAKPSIKRIAVLWDYAPPAFMHEEIGPAHGELAQAGAKLHLEVKIIEVSAAEQLGPALAVLERQDVEGLIVTSGWALSQSRRRVMRFATDRRIPVIADFRWPAAIEPYPLLTYGAPQNELLASAAQYTVRILNGARAADLPIYQPKRFELLINLKTAAALGLEIPMTLRLRAQEVIE